MKGRIAEPSHPFHRSLQLGRDVLENPGGDVRLCVDDRRPGANGGDSSVVPVGDEDASLGVVSDPVGEGIGEHPAGMGCFDLLRQRMIDQSQAPGKRSDPRIAGVVLLLGGLDRVVGRCVSGSGVRLGELLVPIPELWRVLCDDLRGRNAVELVLAGLDLDSRHVPQVEPGDVPLHSPRDRHSQQAPEAVGVLDLDVAGKDHGERTGVLLRLQIQLATEIPHRIGPGAGCPDVLAAQRERHALPLEVHGVAAELWQRFEEQEIAILQTISSRQSSGAAADDDHFDFAIGIGRRGESALPKHPVGIVREDLSVEAEDRLDPLGRDLAHRGEGGAAIVRPQCRGSQRGHSPARDQGAPDERTTRQLCVEHLSDTSLFLQAIPPIQSTIRGLRSFVT